MDLPTCPSCGQSVLDDDVEDCPFCGASMTGKPSSSPATATPDRSSSSGAATSTESDASSRPASGNKGAATAEKKKEDDPFELERAAETKQKAARKVIPLRARPQQGRRHEVVCPMCETVGYTARKAAGREVRCVNPDCQIPVFTAPPLSDAEAEQQASDENTRRKLLTPPNIGIASGVVIVGLLVLWYFSGTKTMDPAPNGPAPNPNVADKSPDEIDKPKNPDPDGGIQGKNQNQQTDPASRLKAVRVKALLRLQRDATVSEHSDLTKVISRQFAADAYAHAGELDKAEKQLRELQHLTNRRGGEFYQIRPLVAMAWQLLQRGTPDARQQADELLQSAQKIAPQLTTDLGRLQYDAASLLAAPLFVLGRTDDAQGLMNRPNGDDPVARESLLLQTVRHSGTFDMEAALKHRSVRLPASPQRVAVTWILAGYGRWQAGLTWAQSQPSRADRDDCLAAWGEARVARLGALDSGDSELPTIAEIAAQLQPANQAAFYARIAVRQFRDGRTQAAQQSLQKAQNILSGLPAPSKPEVPSIKQVVEYRSVSEATFRTTAMKAAAAAEVAHAQLVLDPDNVDAAWKTLSRSVAYCRSLAPASGAVQRLKTVSRNDVAQALELKLPGAIARQYAEFRRRVRMIGSDSDRRLQLQARILQQAILWDVPELLQPMWKAVDVWSSPSQGDVREEWFATRVPWMLVVKFYTGGDKPLGETIRRRIKNHEDTKQKRRDEQISLWVNVHFDLQPGSRRGDMKAAERLASRGVSSSVRRLLALQIVSRFVKAGDLKTAHNFCRALEQDRVLQIDAFDLMGAHAVREHDPETVWELIETTPLRPAESVAICHGFVIGLKVPESKAGGGSNVEE